MDRFIWLANYDKNNIRSDFKYSQESVRLYDGENKVCI